MDRRSFLTKVTAAGVAGEAAAASLVADSAGFRTPSELAQAHETRRVTWNVKGFTCITCSVGLEVMMRSLKGVTRVRASYPANVVSIGYDDQGAIQIPRIGQEVVVDFLEGDPDRPLIIGRVYNAEQMPPYSLPDDQTISGVKSRSSKGGGSDNYNEIVFEDKKGSEFIRIRAEKDVDEYVEHDTYEYIGNDRHLMVDGSQAEMVAGDKHLTVKGNSARRSKVIFRFPWAAISTPKLAAC